MECEFECWHFPVYISRGDNNVLWEDVDLEEIISVLTNERLMPHPEVMTEDDTEYRIDDDYRLHVWLLSDEIGDPIYNLSLSISREYANPFLEANVDVLLAEGENEWSDNYSLYANGFRLAVLGMIEACEAHL
jgi:hypothetical protein